MMNGAPAPLQADDPKARFGDNVDNYDGDADASGSLFDLNTSSCATHPVPFLIGFLKNILTPISRLWGRIHLNADELGGACASNPTLFRECLEYHDRS
jgi:hypothetical protein